MPCGSARRPAALTSPTLEGHDEFQFEVGEEEVSLFPQLRSHPTPEFLTCGSLRGQVEGSLGAEQTMNLVTLPHQVDTCLPF